MITLQEFIKKYDGKTVDFDGNYGGQCCDLFNQYLNDCLDIQNPIQQFPVASAYQIYSFGKSNPNFVCIDNQPTNVPQSGDIIVWGQGVGVHGHVAIFIEGDVMSFRSFDQNWNNVQKCKIISHPYDYVTGWLRPKRNVPEVTPVVAQQIVPTPVVEPIKDNPKPLIDLSILDGNKTKIITSISIVIAILAQQGYLDQKLVETINLIATALIGYTLRDAIKKK